MPKRKENIFLDKFLLLNSQENAEDIIWSLSDSSEYEEPQRNEKFNNITNKALTKKRKRKIKGLKNISNLTITVQNTSKESNILEKGETSPILTCKTLPSKSVHLSPILGLTQTRYKILASPILSSKSKHSRSPIFASESPKLESRVKRTLFLKQEILSEPSCREEYNQSCNSDIEGTSHENTGSDHISEVKTVIDDEMSDDHRQSGIPTISNQEKSSKAKLELANKVKSFFDSHFSSQSTPQNSQTISEIHTQSENSKISEEVEILSCKTQIESKNNSSISTHSSENSVYSFSKSNKKVRYKKCGLAYRLNKLLKKQTACLSLWQHEKFLAANSNFLIPKGEHLVFRIQKVYFNYGCYLLEVVDLEEENYLVLVNNCYVFDRILNNNILKVYEPFKVVQYNKDTKLVINVYKFECSQYKM